MVNRVIGPVRHREFQLSVTACRRDHLRTKELRHLDGGVSEAATGGPHQDRVASFHFRAGDEPVPGRPEVHRKCGRGLEVEAAYGQQVFCVKLHVLCVTAVRGDPEQSYLLASVRAARLAVPARSVAEHGVCDDLTPWRHVIHSLRDLDYLSRHVGTQDVREVSLVPAVPRPNVHPVDAAGLDPDESLSIPELWVRCVLVDEDLRSTLSVKADGLQFAGLVESRYLRSVSLTLRLMTDESTSIHLLGG